MEIRIYNTDFELLGIIENQTSFIWNRKYNEVGSFTIQCPLMPRNIDLLKQGNFVWVQGKPEAGLIEDVTLDQGERTREMKVGGRFLDSYLDRRIIFPEVNKNDKVELIMRQLFTDAFGTTEGLELGELKGFDETVDMQAGYKSLLETEQDLAKGANFGFRFIPDFHGAKVTFDIYKGVDRSVNQGDRPRVIFSGDYANLITAEYKYNNQLSANVCIVGGEGLSDGDPQKKYVIAGDNSLTGLARREMYILGKTRSEGLSIENYRNKLMEEGNETLQEAQEADSFTCTINPNGNFKYVTDFDVGDIVTVIKEEWGINRDYRITEVSEIYEAQMPKIEVTLGTTLPSKIKWEV